ncbi:exported hypothetical protein [Verrucomicrobia bacterium]|nr:exported hypothetical protein [Verrucomicrobiota bacterium]
MTIGANYWIAAALLCFGAQPALADYLFSWHGESNLWQASFEVTDAELQPGSSFGSPLFYSSLSFKGPDGIAFNGNNSSDSISASFGPPFELNLQLWSDNNDFWVWIVDGPPNGMNGAILESTSPDLV